jgi:hypothetical protein
VLAKPSPAPRHHDGHLVPPNVLLYKPGPCSAPAFTNKLDQQNADRCVEVPSARYGVLPLLPAMLGPALAANDKSSA